MFFQRSRKFAFIACFTVATCVSSTSFAKEENGDVSALLKAMEMQSKRLADQEKKLDEQQKILERQRADFARERVQFEKLQMQFSKVTGKPIPQQDSHAPTQSSSADSKPVPQEVGTDRKQSTEKPPEIAAVIEEGGVLLQKGKLVVTPAVEYTHSTSTRVSISGFSIIPALNIGAFDISKVKRDILSPSVGLRYGVTNRFEVDARVPYVYRSDATSTRQLGVPNPPETLTTVDGADLGDIEVGAHYQINDGQDGWPYFVGNMRFKTITGTGPFEVPVVNGVQTELPTGSGFYAFQPSVTAIFPSDPLVYYSNVGYLHSLGRSFPTYGKVEPGDSISASFGSSLSLNEKSSISLGYSHSTVLKTKINDANIANSTILQVGSLDLGYSYLLNDTTNLNFTLSAGLTDDAPDIRLIFRTPMTFDIGAF
ncbi:MAG: transporter [Alphaproteobacteria bacterium]